MNNVEVSTTFNPKKYRLKYKTQKAIILILLIVGALIMVAPFLWVFSSSLRPFSEAIKLPPKWLPPSPLNWDFANYKVLFSKAVPFLDFFKNSFKVSAVATAGIVINSALAGYAFARLKFPGREALFYLLLLSMMIPIQVIIIPLFLLMRHFGLVDSHMSLMLPGILGAFAPGMSGAFGVFLFRQFFKTIPESLEEAAKIDGAGYWTVFWKIVLPQAKPSLAALTILTFTASWNEYFLPLIFINTLDKMLLPVGILAIRQPFGTGDPIEFAAVTLSILPVLIFFLLSQEWIVETFVRAGTKE